MERRLIISAVILLLLVSAACGKFGSGTGSSAYISVNGEKMTEDDLKKFAPQEFESIRSEYNQNILHLLKNAAQKKMIEAEAKEKGLKPEQYIQGVSQQLKPVTPRDVEQEYLKQKESGLFPNKTLSDVTERITKTIERNRMDSLFNEEMYRLMKKYKYVYSEGKAKRFQVSIDNEPARGKPDAKITIVEFTDFKCYYCGVVRTTAEELVKKYGDKIRWVVKDSPFQPGAREVHIAANCVQRQSPDLYWKYFDILFSQYRERDTYKPEQLLNIAAKIGADTGKLKTCLKDPAVGQEIDADMQEGQKLGVQGTPKLFINGLEVKGAVPFLDFAQIIESEL